MQGLVGLPALNYREPLPPIRRGHYRVDRLRSQRRVQQVTNRPDPLGNAERHRWRAAEAFMHAAQIVVGDVTQPTPKVSSLPLFEMKEAAN